MLMQIRPIAGLTLSLLLAATAFAASSQDDCFATIEGRNVEAISTNTDGVYDVKLIVDGKAVPVMGGHCFEYNRPGTRHLLCAFDANGLRVDLYPWAETTSGAFTHMQFVVWHGGVPSTPQAFNSCKH